MRRYAFFFYPCLHSYSSGFDIAGHNVYVHDCNCYAQDDCFTVKDNYDGKSTNMLFENNNASGMAMVIGR